MSVRYSKNEKGKGTGIKDYCLLVHRFLSVIASMEPVNKDITPADEWLLSLNATCNRLSNQYLNLLKSASSIVALHNTQTATTITATSSVTAADSSFTNTAVPVVASSSTATVAATIVGVGSSSTTATPNGGGSNNQIHQHDPRGM
jgi:hypothetical protein